MRVFGLMTDREPKVPFPKDGDGHLAGVVVAVALALYFAAFGAVWALLLAVLLTVAMLTGFCFKVRLLGGDVLDPQTPWVLKLFKRERAADGSLVPIPADSTPNWFNALPAGVRRFFCPVPLLPYIALGWGRFGLYLGAKRYGVDSPEYLDFPTVTPSDVYGAGALGTPGSEALCLSIRPTANRTRE